MADGTARPIADVRVGDAIYGTVKDGYYRRYAITEVLAHWSTVKPAYRVTLEDGTRLVASGDHRFLTERGWKHVTGAEQGPEQRPFLTLNNKLMGLGSFAEPPKENADYRRGYLCGMVRGDGHLRSGTYQNRHRDQLRLQSVPARPRRPGSADTNSRLPREVRHRRQGVRSSPAPRADKRREMTAISCYSRDRIRAIEWLISWPHEPSRRMVTRASSRASSMLKAATAAPGGCRTRIQEIINWTTRALGALRLRLRA